MKNITCYNVQKGTDDEIANFIPNWNETRVALMRGLYDSSHSIPLDTSNIVEAAKKLSAYRKELAKNNVSKIKTTPTGVAKDFKQLKENFTATERFDRVNVISSLFSFCVDKLQESNPNLTRSEIINGTVVNGKNIGGEGNIFDFCFNQLMRKRDEAYENGKFDVVAKFDTLFDNWSAMCSLTRIKLRDTENVKLGQKISYSENADENNFGDNDLSQLYNAEESTREGWHEINDMRSSFGSITSEVRRFFSTLTSYDANGNPEVDDLGFKKRLDPVRTHHTMMRKLRGVNSQKKMMRIIQKAMQEGEPWAKAVYEALKDKKGKDGSDTTNYLLRTQCYITFKKNFQPYSIMVESVKDKIKTFKTKIINQVRDIAKSDYQVRVVVGKPVTSEQTSLFDNKGNVSWANVKGFIDRVNSNFSEMQEGPFGKIYGKDPFKRTDISKDSKAAILCNMLGDLGIKLDIKTAKTIIGRKSDINKIVDNLQQIIKYGIEANLTKAELTALENGDFKSIRNMKFIDLLKASPSSSTAKEGNMFEKVGKILNVITHNREELNLESRARWKDRNGNNISLYSDVNPSYLGDFIDNIKSFVDNEDKVGLRNYLKEFYLNSSMFQGEYDGKTIILNKWIEELMNSEMNEYDFAALFGYERFVGSSLKGGGMENNFENFTSKQHAISMMTQYWSERQINKSGKRRNYAKYPVFILGDSGVSKYIRAKRYDFINSDANTQDENERNNKNPIISGLYNVYRSEKRRMAQTKAAHEKLTKGGFKTIVSYKSKSKIIDKANEFTMLPFLNKDFKSADGKIGKYYEYIKNGETEENVKKAIRAYMEDSAKEFMKRLDEFGLLEVKEDKNGKKTYVYLNQEVNDNISLEEVVKDFYYNTKFATIMQLQMMTIDSCFYTGTKELQKRYKEIHAPGTILDLEARNPYSQEHELFLPLDENGNPRNETCVYFEDISLDTESINAEFADVLAWQFGKKVAPKGSSDEQIREYGRKTKEYKLYKENTLTDGQGYRTLSSYRAVMGMAGKWTKEMENVYNDIMNLREKYTNQGLDIPAKELAMIENASVIFQPIKPYMYTIENYPLNDNDYLKIPVQHKYSEAVIIPELLPKGNKLRDMALWMENHKSEDGKPQPIDLVASNFIVKTGEFGTTKLDIPNGKDVSYEDKRNAFENCLNKGYVHQLNYGDYRIQTNVPEHMNIAQLFGTQVRKLVMAGVNKAKSYNYTGGKSVNLGKGKGKVVLNGRNLISFYNALVVSNILESQDSFEADIQDPKTVSEMLMQSVTNNERESMDNLMAYGLTEDEARTTLELFEGGLEHDASAFLFSIFKKRVNKQRIKGGSLVQASAMGIDGYEEDGGLSFIKERGAKNILYAELEMPFDITVKNQFGKDVALNYDDWCNEDGTLKLDMSKELDMSKRENMIYQSYYVVDGNGDKHYYKPLIEVKYPDILSLVAYRIPTEKDYSMINGRIKRFTRKTAGGTIKVPAEGTTIAGFDFDIDKLYFMRKEFNFKTRVHKSNLTATKLKEFLGDSLYDKFLENLSAQISEDTKNANTPQEVDNTIGAVFGKLFKDAGLADRINEQDVNENQSDSSEYVTNENTVNQIRNAYIWAKIYEMYPEIHDALADARREYLDELKNTDREKDPNIDGRLMSYWNLAIQNNKEIFGKFDTADKLFNHVMENSGIQLNDIFEEYIDEYDFDKTPLENSRTARNNMLLTLISQRLMDEETFDSRYTPGGFANSSRAARIMRELLYGDLSGIAKQGYPIDFDEIDRRIDNDSPDPEPNYDPSDPLTMIIYNQQNQVAGKLIGIFANQNANHAFASLMDSFTISNKRMFGFCGHNSYNDFLNAPEGIDVDTNVAEFLAASVDAVKDPVLNFLNLNTITADCGAVLARLGYTTTEIGLLFNQPIIKELCEYAFNNNKRIDEALRYVKKKYSNVKVSDINSSIDFSSDMFARNIINDRVMKERGKSAFDNEGFVENQLKVLSLFENIQKVTSDVSDFVSATKFTASNSVGSTFGDFYAQQMRVERYIKKLNTKNGTSLEMVVNEKGLIDPISNRKDVLFMSNEEYLSYVIDNPLAYEQAMYDMNRRMLIAMNGNYFPYDTDAYINMRNCLSRISYNGILDADTINSAHSEMLVFLLTEQGGMFNPYYPCISPSGKRMNTREYYTEQFPIDMFNIIEDNTGKYSELKKLPIFKYLHYGIKEVQDASGPIIKTKNIYTLNIQDVGGLQPYQKEEIKESWAQLYREYPDIAESLFMYNFYNLGFTFSPLSFMNLAPVELKQNLKVGETGMNYDEFLKKIQKGEIELSINQQNSFARQFILNHLDNYRFTSRLFGDELKFVNSFAKSGNMYKDKFELDISSVPDDVDVKTFLINDTDATKDQYAFKPCIIINGITYVAQTETPNVQFNISSSPKITYVKEEQQGVKNQALSYFPSSQERKGNNMVSELAQQSPIDYSEGNNDSGETFNKDNLINTILIKVKDALIKSGRLAWEQIPSFEMNFFNDLTNSKDNELTDFANKISKSEEIHGELLLDSEGNPIC